jgi:HYDIN/CFA65/VesB-like, Ig-like domain
MRHNHSIHRHVETFAIAIVSILALVSSAQAEIVYHPTDIAINGGAYNLDLNGDGVTDFTIAVGGGGCPPSAGVSETPASGNGALAGPLTRGAEIGPNQSFDGAEVLLAGVGLKKVWWGYQPCYFGWGGGPDPGAKTGYLGLSLQLNGQTYYGWARLQVKWSASKTGTSASAKLLGYAYEDTPGRAILAGETSYVWFTPATLNFGTVTRGNVASGSVTLTNLGSTTLLISNAKVGGINAADFASENGNPPCTGSVAAGATCTLTFTFTPSISGKEIAAYAVYDNSGGSPQKLPLTGTGQ